MFPDQGRREWNQIRSAQRFATLAIAANLADEVVQW